MTSKIPVSVIVPVKNEEANLGRCLSHLNRFAELVVVDSGSVDRTQEIARHHRANVVQFEWNGRFPKKRNWYLLHHRPACDWVLFLDADEIVSDAFCDEAAIAVGTGGYDGFWLNYTNFFLGKPLLYGERQRKLALFRFGKGLYEQIDEESWSSLDMEVHEHPVIQGKVGEIRARIKHSDDSGLATFIDRHRNYAMWEARRAICLRQSGEQIWSNLTRRQRTKYRYIRKAWFPWLYFTYTYFVRLGVLDGQPGFSIAFYKLWYFYTTRLIIINEESRINSSTPS